MTVDQDDRGLRIERDMHAIANKLIALSQMNPDDAVENEKAELEAELERLYQERKTFA
jgi:hypothetical protein